MKKSILIYVIGNFIAPVIRVGGIELSFNLWCFPIIFFIYLFNRRNIILKKGALNLIPYFFIYLILAMITSVIYGGSISLATIYATIRFILTINFVLDAWEGELIAFVDKTLTVVLFLNFICSVLQMTSIAPVEFFYNLYYKKSFTPLQTQMDLGYFNRAYGTTGSPVLLGGIVALAYAFYFSIFVSGENKVKSSVFKIIECIICGILSLSKTAILAIPITTVYILVVKMFTMRIKDFLKIIVLIFIGVIGLLLLMQWMQKENYAIMWYLNYLTDPLKALETRFNSDSGFLVGTIEIIKKHLLFGVGDATFEGAFIGDSTYVVLLYNVGLVGLVTYLLPYCFELFKAIYYLDVLKSSLIITLLLIAVGSSLHVAYWIIPFVVIIFDYSEKESKNECNIEQLIKKVE